MSTDDFDRCLDKRAREVLDLLARSGWRLWDRWVPRNPEQRKSLERLYMANAEARRLEDEGKLDEASRGSLRELFDVDPSEYTFRTSTWIETASSELDWLNKGVFVGVGGRRPGSVIYETYLVA